MAALKYCCICVIIHSLLIGYAATQDATVRFTVREERPINTLVGSVAVESLLFTNVSNEEFQQLTFQILTLGNKYVTMFKIENDTSLLWTNEVIDREDFLDCYETCEIDFNVAVYAADFTIAPKIIKTIINIDDYNDNKPEFLFIQQELRVSEATDVGEVIIRESAVDLDQDPRHAVQTYTLLPQTENFELEIVSGEELEFKIILKQKLDRETSPLFKIVIIAEDGGTTVKNTGTLMLDIVVTDDNDNFPKFSREIYNTSIAENITLNSTVFTFQATDIDEGDNAKLAYTFSNRVPDRVIEHFTINSTSGELTVSGLIDYEEEKEKEFSFEVLAVDHGSQPKSTAVDVRIKIEDVNDNFPQININQPPGGTALSETVAVDSFVAHVEVADKDSGKNGMVTCNILDPHFRLDDVGIPNNYRIVVNKKLDHDTNPEINVTIICQDGGDLPKQSTAYFIVRVSDHNDNFPIFTKEKYSASIIENNEMGISVLEVSATDADSGANGLVKYSLQAESAKLFNINTFTGVIVANTSLDREIHGEEIIFRVLATDGGDPVKVSTGTIVVKVLDLNDNSPIFKSDPFKFSVYENQENDTIVGNISVTDPDKGLNGTFYMRYPASENVLKYFKFSETGIVTTTQPLDRELVALHEFYVYAVDYGGRTSSALVTISVEDENDNQPQILYPNREDNLQTIPFSTTAGTPVLQVNARDYDKAENSELFYYLDNDNASHTFTTDVLTGVMYINSTMHTGDIGDVYMFNIRVTDGGSPKLSASTIYYIQIVEGELLIGEDAEADSNLIIIVVIVVSVTLVLSLIMITVMIRICVNGRRRSGGSTGSSEIIMESNKVDPRLLDSSSSSTSSKDSNGNEKLKNDFPDSFLRPGEESGSMLNTTISSIDKHLEEQMYIDKVKQLGYEISKKTDETNSDNSGEMGTRDSGQGGSDLDMISLSELPVLDIPESPTGSKSGPSVPSPRDEYNSYYGNRKVYPNSSDNTINQSNTDNTRGNPLVGNFSRNPSKTAERRDISKLRRNPKKVMFSDDLENSSATSNTLSSVSFSDTDNTVPSPRTLMFDRVQGYGNSDNMGQSSRSPPVYNKMHSFDLSDMTSGGQSSRTPAFNRMHSYDSSGTDIYKHNFDSRGHLRRSVDHLLMNRNNGYPKETTGEGNNFHRGEQYTGGDKNLPTLMERPQIPAKPWKDDSSVSNVQVFSLSQNVSQNVSRNVPDSTQYRASFPNNYSVQLTDYPSSPSGTDDTYPSELCV